MCHFLDFVPAVWLTIVGMACTFLLLHWGKQRMPLSCVVGTGSSILDPEAPEGLTGSRSVMYSMFQVLEV